MGEGWSGEGRKRGDTVRATQRHPTTQFHATPPGVRALYLRELRIVRILLSIQLEVRWDPKGWGKSAEV